MIMNREKVRELLKRRSTKVGSVVLAAAIVFGGSMWAWQDSQNNNVPELVVYVDPGEDVTIEGEDVPLGKASVNLTVGESKTLMASKLKKVKGKITWKSSKKSVATVSSSGEVKGVKAGKAKITAKAGKKKQTWTVVVAAITETKTSEQESTVKTGAAQASATQAAPAVSGEVSIGAVAPRLDARVLRAYTTLGFKITVDPETARNGGYTGKFDSKSGTIILTEADDTVYHELGHFVAFIANNYDLKGFQAVYAEEKGKYTAYNKLYVTSTASEYFAESFKDYTLDPNGLRSSRPKTFAAIEEALSMVTDTQVSLIQRIYGSLWK